VLLVEGVEYVLLDVVSPAALSSILEISLAKPTKGAKTSPQRSKCLEVGNRSFIAT
jgi:hypothetical protein